jgi:hypothetical protein
MPHDIRVIVASEFLRADVHGNVDLATSKRILEDLAQACAGHPDRHILIDVRSAGVPMLSSVDLYELVQTLCRLGLGVLNRIAILRRHPDKFDRGRFFEMLATERGFNVGAFEDFEKAFDWLHVGGTATKTNERGD